MNIHLKQRLVGALVLLAAAAVFLPMLFEAPKKILLDRQSQIPQSSPFKKFQLVEPATRTVVLEHKTSRSEKNSKAASNVSSGSTVSGRTTPEKPTQTQQTAKSTAKQSSKPETSSSQPAFQQSQTPQLDKQGLPVAWVIQVASFVKKENASKLKDELRAKDFSAYTKRIDTSRGPAVRVFVGPKLDKKRAEKVKQRLDKEFKLNTLIVRSEM